MGLTLITSDALGANTNDNVVFRATGRAISNSFADSGWVQANDAGQIDWTTVVANGTIGTYFGCEIWRMNDALANTTPCYIRIDYGTNSTTANRWVFNITMGHSTNGALGLRGALSVNTAFAPSGALALNTTYPCYFHGDSSSWGMILWEGFNYPVLFALERTKDANGTNTSDGFNVLQGVNTIGQYFWSPWTGQSVLSTENPGCFTGQNAANRSGIGSAFHWYPIYVSNGKFNPPMLNWMISTPYQCQSNSIMTVTHYGASRTYRMVNGITATTRSGSIAAILGMRWE
jgi:hypothetical protein